MNFNNRLSSTLANNIKLDSNVEHEAEKIAGGNIIWLVNRPAGVKIYVNSTPDRTGALVLNEANRGYKWEELGEYGSLKLYDNFYIWTEGISLNNEKIELQISPNADIITPILGNTADKIGAIDSLEKIGNQAEKQLYNIGNNAILNDMLYNNYINITRPMQITEEESSALQASEIMRFIVCNLCNISKGKIDDESFYKISINGSILLNSLLVSNENKDYYRHDLFLELANIDNKLTDFIAENNAESSQEFYVKSYIDRGWYSSSKKQALQDTINNKSNDYFIMFSGFNFRSIGNTGTEDGQKFYNIEKSFIFKGDFLKQRNNVIFYLKSWLYNNNYSSRTQVGFTASLNIQVSKTILL